MIDYSQISDRNRNLWDSMYLSHEGNQYPHEGLVIYVSRLKQQSSSASP